MNKREQEKYLKYGKIAIVAYLAFKLIKPMGTAGATISNVIATKTENETIKASTGLNENEISLCRDVAQKCKDAMYVEGFWQMSWFGGSTEDEDEIVMQLNRLNSGAQAQMASNFYQTLAGSSLASDVNKHIDSDDRKKIKSIILPNLV